MEDGWILAQALKHFSNDLTKALPVFDELRLPYYRRMYAYLEGGAKARKEQLQKLRAQGETSEGDLVKNKIIKAGGTSMDWIYENHIGKVWNEYVEETRKQWET
jgi:salicylate hydroxylase